MYSGDRIWEINSLRCAVSKTYNGVSHHYSPQNSNSDSHPRMTVPLWEPESHVEKFQHAAGEKHSTIIDMLKKARSYLHCPSHKAVQLSAERDPLSQRFLPQGKVRAREWVPSFPSYVRCCPRGPVLSSSAQNTEVTRKAEGMWEAASTAANTQSSSNGHRSHCPLHRLH